MVKDEREFNIIEKIVNREFPRVIKGFKQFSLEFDCFLRGHKLAKRKYNNSSKQVYCERCKNIWWKI